MTRFISCATALLLFVAASSSAADRPRIAIIIDDLGYRLDAGRRAIDLPGPLAFAVLPGTPKGELLATLAFEQGKEVLLHLPFQASDGDTKQEPGGIDLDMSRQAFGETFEHALTSVPYATGVNNHRGSMLTRHPGHMQWLMEEISKQGDLFFIDSYTTHHSVALQFADEAGVAARKRDVFLDPDQHPETVAREFERMKELAVKRGVVVAIGHPYPATLALLEQELPKLAEQGFDLVTISELLN